MQQSLKYTDQNYTYAHTSLISYNKAFMIRKILIGFTIPIALNGCANGYKNFYKPVNGMTPESIAQIRATPPPSSPLVERIPPINGAAATDTYSKRGYTLIGSAEFNSGRKESEQSAIEQGKAVGADLVVILNPQLTGSESSIIPITTPTTTTTYSTGSATAYGSGGSVTAYGSGTSTTYGTATNYIPITIHRTNYGAGYFVKQKIIIGAQFRDLNDGERKELQTNKGVVINLVVDESPAFKADILPGDIATSPDGISILNASQFSKLISERRGNRIMLGFLRDGRSMNLPIQLNP
jgi:hypothetical protein